MRNPSLWKSTLAALGTAVLLTACGGVETEAPDAPPQDTAQDSAGAGEVQALGPTSCDREYYCRVRSSSVRCADGFYVSSYWTTDGWCIEPDACASHGGPIICPLL